MIRLIAGAKRALGLHQPGRQFDVFPDDTFLVSYPKSGNTWTRFLIANLVFPDKQVDFTTINELTPDPEALTKRHLARMPRPRIIKSHQYFDPRYLRVIYIVRDPRDVLLSAYHFDIKRNRIREGYSLEEYVTRFTGPQDGHQYGNWGENVASWIYVRGNDPGFLLVRYEELQSAGMRELARIAEFMGIEADSQRLTSALERSTADRMRELEREQANRWSSTKETRKDMPFVRAAKSGGWKQELPEKCVVQVEKTWGNVMTSVGYELVASTLTGAGRE
jgi:hypothetical protein